MRKKIQLLVLVVTVISSQVWVFRDRPRPETKWVTSSEWYCSDSTGDRCSNYYGYEYRTPCTIGVTDQYKNLTECEDGSQ